MPSQPKTYNFNLEEFKITAVHFEVNVKFKNLNKTVDIATQIALDSNFIKTKKQLLLKIGLRQTKTEAPFIFEIKALGVFRFDKNPDSETLEKLSNINCPAIIFPYVREIVADLTRRAGFAPLHLAPINFVALAEERKKRKA